ncbi:MAG: PEP-CTERM sorting domain-containing protein [Caulobacteraceae bacterium]
MKLSHAAALAAAVALPGSTLAAGASFYDDTFPSTNYSSVGTYTANGATISEATCATCGQGGPALDFTEVTLAASDQVTDEAIVNSTWTYDPATQGAITKVIAFTNKELNSSAGLMGLTFGNVFHPVIFQDGNVYIGSISGGDYAGSEVPYSSGYSTIAGELTAADFTLYDFSTGAYGVGNPNFSASGDSFTLGVAQFGTTGFASTWDVDYDVLGFTLAVPEPAVWALMLAGFAGLGLALRGRRSIMV